MMGMKIQRTDVIAMSKMRRISNALKSIRRLFVRNEKLMKCGLFLR